MKISRISLFVASICCAFVCSSRAFADSTVNISVVASSAPNAYGSSNWAQYVANAQYALEHNLTSYGTPGTASYYQAAPDTMSSIDNIVTGFPSWNGVANPAAPYDAEYGNRIQFGVKLDTTDGSKLAISNLAFAATSTNTSVDNDLSFGYGVGSYTYNSDYIGVNWGIGGVGDYSTATYITSGSADQLVDELVGRGSGNAWAVYDDPSYAGATLQDKINNFNATLGNDILFTGTYTYGSASGSDSILFNSSKSVPETSSTLGLMALALAGIFGAHKIRLAKIGFKALAGAVAS